jgi:hypothetical protein
LAPNDTCHGYHYLAHRLCAREYPPLKVNELNVIEEPVESVLPTSSKPTYFDGIKISIYPNPVSTTLNIRLFGANVCKKVTITDVSGAVVQSAILKSEHTSLLAFDVNDLKPGFYIVVVETDKGRFVDRFSKF